MSDAAFVGRPDEFVHLQLETNRQRVRDDAFDKLLRVIGVWPGGADFSEDVADVPASGATQENRIGHIAASRYFVSCSFAHS